MNKRKWLAIIFSLLSFGAIQETFRIFTSPNSDIADNRTSLMPLAVIMTGVIVFFTIKFWLKSSNQQGQK